MRRPTKFMLALLMALVGNLSASAYDFEVDGFYYNTLSLQEMTCEMTYKDNDYKSYSGDVAIPSSVTYAGKTFKVTKIGDYAFYRCRDLTSVTIPNSVVAIGEYAFDYCPALTSITIPNSVTSIGRFAFSGCSGLTSVIIPNSVTSIGSGAFYKCSSLTTVTIPSSVTEIDGGAFQGCSGLISITISNSVTAIDVWTFSGCSSLTSIIIPNSVTAIDYGAFSGCTSLKEITSLNPTPPSVKNEYSFYDVSKTECVVKVPDESVSAYQSANVWSTFWNIVGLNGGSGDDNPETKKCADPVITLVDGKIVATSATESATCYTSITSDDFKGVDTNSPIELTGIYTISSYAHAEGYENSETVTALLVWINPTSQEANNILSMDTKKAVVIKTVENNIVVCGTEQGETIQLYSLDGMLLDSATAADGETTIPYSLQQGQIYIIKYGNKSIKYKF